LSQAVRTANGFPDALPGGYSKYFVGGGNNFPLVKQVLKFRWWLTQADRSCEADIIWTSWAKTKIINMLPDQNSALIDPALKLKIYSKMEFNDHLADKKALFQNITAYKQAKGENPLDVIPLTYLIESEV